MTLETGASLCQGMNLRFKVLNDGYMKFQVPNLKPEDLKILKRSPEIESQDLHSKVKAA